MRSTKSTSPATSSNSGWWLGLRTVTPTGTPRASAMAGVTFGAGRTPPRPGLAPWLSFNSTALTGAESRLARKLSMQKRPSAARAPK